MKTPLPLTPGDDLALVAPAGPVEESALKSSIAWLDKTFKTHRHPQCLEKTSYLAGSDSQRHAALQKALDDETTKAIIAARGGYGTSRLVDNINFDAFVKKPKWIVGSSDLTALLIHIWAHYQIQTIHGPMAFRFGESTEEDLDALKTLLLGQPWTPPGTLTPLFPGEANGPLIGGNLTILASLMGTLPKDFADDAILFLEDVNEPTYDLDRSLTQLNRSGILKRTKGIVLGAFTNCTPGRDNYTPEDMFKENLKPLNIPVATGYPGAHGERNYPFVHGGKVTLKVDSERATLSTGDAHTRSHTQEAAT